MIQPVYNNHEALTRETFLALMWSFSYPGQVQHFPAQVKTTPDAFVAIAQTLLDLETTYFTTDERLRAELERTGARAVKPQKAAYHFYTTLDLDVVQAASAGTMLFPDQNATLLIAAELGRGTSVELSGPGIPTTNQAIIGGIPAAFWTLRERKARYPLGWDIYLVDGRAVLGLPRTTRIDVKSAEV